MPSVTCDFETLCMETSNGYPVRTQPRCLAMPLARCSGSCPGMGRRQAADAGSALLRPATGADLLNPDAWGDYEQGGARRGGDCLRQCGRQRWPPRARQTVVLNQTEPEPIIASVESRCEGVSGSPGADYSLYLDLVHADGTPLWGQSAAFDTGTHGWQRRQVVIVPSKPVRQVSFYLLLRGRAGKAWFATRDRVLAPRRDELVRRAGRGVPGPPGRIPGPRRRRRLDFVRSSASAGLETSVPDGACDARDCSTWSSRHLRQGPRG